MALEKPIIKAVDATAQSYDYKPRDFTGIASKSAQSFVDQNSLRANDFKISELVAQQAGILQLESDAHQDKINAQVLERLAEIQERAYSEGYQLGLVEGGEKAFQETKIQLADRTQAFEVLFKRIEELKIQLLTDNEGELVRLVYLVAKKMALRDLEGNHEVVKEILQKCIGEARANERIVVRVNSEDLKFIESLKDTNSENLEVLDRVKFVAEEAVKAGGCLIETEYGTVDATVEERVERTWQTLQTRIPQHAPSKKE